MSVLEQMKSDAALSVAEAKLNQLKRELSQAEGERDTASATSAGPNLTRLDASAMSLLSGGAAVATAESVAATDARIAALKRAIEMQRAIVEEARSAASLRIAESRRPEYVGILRDGAKALAALRKFILRERAFRDELSVAGVAFASTLRPMKIAAFNEKDIDRWTTEASEYYAI